MAKDSTRDTTNGEQTQTLDETLNKTDLGHVINENKNTILIAGAVIVAVVIGISVYRHQAKIERNSRLDKAFTFQSTVVDPFVEGKTTADEVIGKLKGMDADLVGQADLAPAIFTALNKLVEMNKEADALAIAQKWYDAFPSGEYLHHFTGLRLAPMLENAGQSDKAIAVYESLIAGGQKALESRIYLELGRLYSQAGENSKAKSFFDFILKNHENSEEAKMAALYIQKIGK